MLRRSGGKTPQELHRYRRRHQRLEDQRSVPSPFQSSLVIRWLNPYCARCTPKRIRPGFQTGKAHSFSLASRIRRRRAQDVADTTDSLRAVQGKSTGSSNASCAMARRSHKATPRPMLASLNFKGCLHPFCFALVSAGVFIVMASSSRIEAATASTIPRP